MTGLTPAAPPADRAAAAGVFDKPPIPTTADDILCFFTVHNEADRIPFFLDYYRSMGVSHFFAVDNRSTDGSAEVLRGHHDVHYFHTEQSYVESRAGRYWTSELARFYGEGRWCLTLDVDEILVFPGSEILSLRDLTEYMDDHGQRVLFTVFLDMYGGGALNEAIYEPGRPFWETCRFYEDETYQLRPAMHFPPVQIFGGPRQRIFWNQGNHGMGPCMRKAPLVKWGPDAAYINSTHSFYPLPMSDVTGATLHFKFFASFVELARREVRRGDRVQMADYQKYVEQMERERIVLFNEKSLEYTGSLSLLERGTITCSRRFVNQAGRMVRRKAGSTQEQAFRDAALQALETSLEAGRLSLRHLPAVWPLVSAEYSNPLATSRPLADLPPAAAPPVVVSIEGQVLDAAGGRVVGWARDLHRPEVSVPVEVRSHGVVLARTIADGKLPATCDLPETVRMRAFELDVSDIVAGSPGPTPIDVVAGRQEVFLARGIEIHPPGTAMRDTVYEGACEDHDGAMLRGWGWRRDSPLTSLDVAFYVDGSLWRRVRADGFRGDLVRVGKGTGHYGFAVHVPSELQDGRPRTVDVLFADTGIPLRRSPVTIVGSQVVAAPRA